MLLEILREKSEEIKDLWEEINNRRYIYFEVWP